MSHQPVLLKEVIEYLQPKPGDNFVDATVGDGGHALEILKRVLPQGKVLGLDWDEETIRNLKSVIESEDSEGPRLDTRSIFSSPAGAWEPEPPQRPAPPSGEVSGASRSGIEPRPFKPGVLETNFILQCGNFADLEKIVLETDFKNILGVLFDLGFRTFHLAESGRGFSFQKNEPLDMRYSNETSLTALTIVNSWPLPDLEKIFEEYGEEGHSRKIAKAIVAARSHNKIATTGDLAEIISQTVKSKDIKVLARIFQALRIAVNDEFKNISRGLDGAWQVLKPGGRLAVISFHSLEDRLVKDFCNSKKSQGAGRVVTSKPVTATAEEINLNPKSRSAKLRVIQKI